MKLLIQSLGQSKKMRMSSIKKLSNKLFRKMLALRKFLSPQKNKNHRKSAISHIKAKRKPKA